MKKTENEKTAAVQPEVQAAQTGGGEAPAAASAEEQGRGAAVCAACGLNLREGPGLGFGAVEVLPDGAVLAVLPLPCGAEVPGWALVHTGQRTGWVDSRFIRALEPAETET